MKLIIDNQAMPNAPTSRFLRKTEYIHIYNAKEAEHKPSRMNFIFKYKKAENLDDEFAKLLEKKYPSLEIINKEPEVVVKDVISDTELLDQINDLKSIPYSALKQLAVDKYGFKYRDTMIKKDKLVEMIFAKKKEKYN
tara:strand:+ start:337 stop:750 length:414 start_codon:yes stop_codon:yes gene_type:complete